MSEGPKNAEIGSAAPCGRVTVWLSSLISVHRGRQPGPHSKNLGYRTSGKQFILIPGNDS